jgi:hypothetical protein
MSGVYYCRGCNNRFTPNFVMAYADTYCDNCRDDSPEMRRLHGAIEKFRGSEHEKYHDVSEVVQYLETQSPGPCIRHFCADCGKVEVSKDLDTCSSCTSEREYQQRERERAAERSESSWDSFKSKL